MEKIFAGSRIGRLRRESGMKQVELARLLAISPSYLNQIENDARPLSAQMLIRLTEVFGVDPASFASNDSTRRLAELREALTPEIPTSAESALPERDLGEVARSMPELATAIIQLGRRLRDVCDLVDSSLATVPVASPHEQVRDFFYRHRNYFDPLDRAAESLAVSLGTQRLGVRRKLAEHLSQAHGVRVVVRRHEPATAGPPRRATVDDELHRYDEATKTLYLAGHLHSGQQAFHMATEIAFLEHSDLIHRLIEAESWAGTEASRLARIGLANHFAGALVLPYEPFFQAAERMRYDIELLADHFAVSYETIAHRLSTLQRPRMRGVPFLFVRVDQAGNVSKRQSATAFHFSRAGGHCPLWNVYEAFTTPGRVITQLAEMPDGSRYLWVSHVVVRKPVGFGGPTKTFAIGLGCEIRHATRIVYADGLDVDGTAVPIGPGCKACERRGCPQRSAPQLGSALLVDERRSTFIPYAVDSPK